MSVTTCPLITSEVVILTLQDLDPSSCHEVQKKKKKVFGVLQYSCVSCKTSSQGANASSLPPDCSGTTQPPRGQKKSQYWS